MDLQDRSEFLVRQRVTVMVNRYEVYAPASPGSKEEAELLVFVEQRRMKLKEEIDFFADRDKARPLFSVKAEKAFDPRGTYQLLEPSGNGGERRVIARFKKGFVQSFARSTWHLQDAGGHEAGMAQERNLFAALFRRYASLVPFVGEVLGLMPIAYNFDFFASDGTRQATLERLWGIRDRYRLTIEDTGGALDRRLLVAIAVCMDALQGR